MRNAVFPILVAALFLCTADKPTPKRVGVLPMELTKEQVEGFDARKTDYLYTVQPLRFHERKFLLLQADLGDGVPYNVSALHCHVSIWRRRGFSGCRFERDRFVTFNFRGGDPGDDAAV